MTATHSGYWLDQALFDDEVDVKDSDAVSLARVMRLASIRRATANFVNILTGRNDIPVVFHTGKESFTDGEQVVISGDDNSNNFDSIVGLALHEASHIVKSDFYFLRVMKEVEDSIGSYGQSMDRIWPPLHLDIRVNAADDSTVMSKILHPALAKILGIPYLNDINGIEMYQSTARTFMRDLRVIMNILEDRRIDKWVYQTAGGYRPYYDALYEKYFFTEEIRKNLKWNPQWREVTVENYINRLLLSFHPDASPDALPGLEQLLKMMDLSTIERVSHVTTIKRAHAMNLKGWNSMSLFTRNQYANAQDIPLWVLEPEYNNTPSLWQEANVLYAHILRFAALAEKNKVNPNGAGIQQNADRILDGTDEFRGSDDELDMEIVDIEPADRLKNGKEKSIKFNSKTAKNQMEKVMDLLNGTSSKKKVKRSELDTIRALDQASADLVDIKGDGIPKGQALVTRKITENVLQESWFPFRGWESTEKSAAVAKGRRMGELLVHRLQVRNDPVLTKNTRLQHGGLDRRLLAQLGMDITSVFQKSRVDTHRPAMLHLTLDASGSMHGNKWYKVITVATALAYASTKIRNLDVVVSLRGGNDNIPIVSIIFDSRINSYTHYMKWITKIGPGGATPEGLCFTATMDLILETTNTHDVYFINFSDGEPSFHLNNGVYACGYYGDLAAKHTRAMVQKMRDHGVKVLSYFINEQITTGRSEYSSRMFRQMYGEDASFVNVENATDVLRTLNKLLIKREA